MKLEKTILSTQFDHTRMVTSHEIFSKKSITIQDGGRSVEQKKFADDGLFSRRIFGDIDSQEEYSCDCGHLHGKFYEGTVCPKCNSPVTFIGLSIDKYGWIDLSLSKYNEDGTIARKGNGCHLIEYIPYAQLEKVIGRDNLKMITKSFGVITVEGALNEAALKEARGVSSESKYYYSGIEGFYENYNEILDYYYNLRGCKETELYNFLQNKEEVFTDKILVVSIILRPAMRTADGLKLDDINIKYQNILKNLEMLKDAGTMKIIHDSTIEAMQAEFMMLSEEVLEAVKSKSGIIRNQICGTRINFSARNIISPEKIGYKIDELVVPYSTFLELYKFEIINILKTTENISLREAEQEWYTATIKYDDKVYKIMGKMVNDNEVGVLLNRNPTIAYGSILYLRIAAVKKDFHDVTLSVNNLVLTCMAADYDGDVLNLISIKDKGTRELMKAVFSPIHLIIDPNNGRFNNNLNLERDQILGINSLLE